MKPNVRTISLALAVLGGALAGPAQARDLELGPTEHAYALVVGSNPGGPGQDTLQYAETDARQVARVLRELGGYAPERVTVLARPTPRELLAALDEVAGKLRQDPDSVLFFYYSGHARATALNLGQAELPLAILRKKLLAMPARLTVVVLDACQSGAFSRIKGGEPAADFSFNSVSGLDATGVAVMASSSGSELSQESEDLRSSYFTHHLLAALRGAGDDNGDGRVSLDEAYRYAYQATLTSTARTAVGRQHVTLETALAGKGDIPLTYPARARSHLALDPGLAADLLIRTRPRGAVVAEVHKAAGQPLRIALPPGEYRVLVRRGASAVECDVGLQRGRATALDLGRCAAVELHDATSKGAPGSVTPVLAESAAPHAADGQGAARGTSRIGLELAGGLIENKDDAYVARLQDFGFARPGLFSETAFHYSLALVYPLTDRLHVVGQVSSLGSAEVSRDIDRGGQRFEWTTHTGGLYARGTLPLLLDGRVSGFAQAGGGAARGGTVFTDTDGSTDHEAHWGIHLGAAAGLAFTSIRGRGLFVRVSYDYAPVIENLIGDVHDSGGVAGAVGARYSF